MNQEVSISKIKIIVSATLLIAWILSMVSLFFLLKWSKVGDTDKLTMIFHRGVSRLFNLECIHEGELCIDRPTIHVVNHISYLDVFLLGSIIPGSFIAKSEVSGWPVFGKLATLQNTLFFERNSRRALSQISKMQEHLVHKGNLILFPEGTSTPGTHVESFRSSLFQAADLDDPTIQIQPISVAYTHYGDERMTQDQRDYYAWYIPMPFLSHFLNGMGLKRARARLIFHDPVTLAQFKSRKECASYCEEQVRAGLLFAINETKEIYPERYLAAVGPIIGVGVKTPNQLLTFFKKLRRVFTLTPIMRGSGLLRSITAGLAGFVVYGSWAYYINLTHGFEIGMRAGLVQGSYSLVLTLSTTLLMEYLLTSFQSVKGQAVLTILITSVITFVTAFAIHRLFGTPEILMTIAPGFFIGALYTVFYVFSVNRLNRISESEVN